MSCFSAPATLDDDKSSTDRSDAKPGGGNSSGIAGGESTYDSGNLGDDSSADDEWELFDPTDPEDIKTLTVACKKNQLIIFRRFAETQLDDLLAIRTPQAQDTILHLAARFGHVDILSLLIQKSPAPRRMAFIETLNYSRETALYRACCSGHVECVRVLMQSGASMQPNYFGETPFYTAAYNGHTTVVQYLLSLPNCPSMQGNADNLLPDVVADTRGHVALARLIREHNQSRPAMPSSPAVASYTGTASKNIGNPAEEHDD